MCVEQESGGEVRIENRQGVVNVYRAQTLQIIDSESAGKAVERLVGGTLVDGIDSVEVQSGQDGVLAQASRDEAFEFRAISTDLPLLESTADLWLVVESPVFKDGNKWKFADDRGSLFASILDDAFLARVRDGEERFGCGDRLLVSLRTRQSQTATGYKAEREILAVREHREPMRQHEIFSPH